MENKSEKKRSWLRITGLVVGVLLLISLGIGLWKSREIYRFYKVVTLFDEGNIVENFRSMAEIFPYHEVKRADPVFEFGSAPQVLPESFTYRAYA